VSQRRLVDTNLIVRSLVPENEKQARAARHFFEACERGEFVLVLLPAVLAECVFVLESFYEKARTEIASALSALISSPGVEMSDAAIHLDGLERYRKTRVHFVDCVIAATAAAEDTPVATFGQDFRKFADVRVEIQ